MPELPEVETVLRSVAPATTGCIVESAWTSTQRLHSQRPLPRAQLRRHVVGETVAGWRRRGKYLLVDLVGSPYLIVFHLGMSGRLHVHAAGAKREHHTHLVLGFSGEQALHFVDVRRFGLVCCTTVEKLAENVPALASMGPEPLSRAFNARAFGRVLAGSRRAIKDALLDQRVVAGVGNIYAAEALWSAGIDPLRPCCSLTHAEHGKLVRALKKTLRTAIKHCGTTFRDYRDGWGVMGRYQGLLKVYGRAGEPCRRCKCEIQAIRQAGRATFLCAHCQR